MTGPGQTSTAEAFADLASWMDHLANVGTMVFVRGQEGLIEEEKWQRGWKRVSILFSAFSSRSDELGSKEVSGMVKNI